jgi:spermidine/putrescine transport system permease protein
MLILVANSFNASKFGGTWQGFSLVWYQALLHDRAIWRALKVTLWVASSATLVSSGLGTLAALALHRYRSRLQRLHQVLVYAPLVVPDILVGISLLLFFVALGIQLSFWTIFLAHTTFCMSYVAMVVLARLQDFDHAVLEAAQDLGANSFVVATRILIPLIAPGILSGALLAFTLSIDDYVITFFVAGPGSTTLPIHIYSMIKRGNMPLINALSTIMITITFVSVWTSQHLVARRK